jgi:hypothetical protein
MAYMMRKEPSWVEKGIDRCFGEENFIARKERTYHT